MNHRGQVRRNIVTAVLLAALNCRRRQQGGVMQNNLNIKRLIARFKCFGKLMIDPAREFKCGDLTPKSLGSLGEWFKPAVLKTAEDVSSP